MSYTNGLDDPTLYFNTKLYTGNGSTQSITGVGFQPDWVWIKHRNGASGHFLFDTVRGVLKRIRTDNTNAETTSADSLTTFGTDGFTLGTESGVNVSGGTFASWNWLASNTTASNTDGSITSTVSANTTSGFSIVSYTGTGANATVGHGIDTPKMIIVKNISVTKNWCVYHHSIGNAKIMKLNATDAETANTTTFNSTSPNSSVFTVGTSSLTNSSGENFIAYCFAEKKGFSKFGSYTGNGNADGTFIYTGFKPAWVMIKRTDSAHNWTIVDSTRSINDGSMEFLLADTSSAEDTDPFYDIVSNGFKLRDTALRVNASGGTYIYMCFAEAPFTTSTGIPTTAR